MKKFLLLYFIISIISCKNDNYRFAILEYVTKGKNHIVRINDPVKLKVLQNGISSLKQGAIIIPIVYELEIGLKNCDTLKYWCNGSVMMDSTRRFYMPKGKVQEDFIKFLKSSTPGMAVDEEAGGY